MNGGAIGGEVGPAAYAAWRASRLGAITDGLERKLMFDLMGDVTGRSVLDVGCGDGAFALAVWRRGAEVTGIDPDPSMIAAARQQAAAMMAPAEFLEGRAEQLPFPAAAFDVVVAVTVLCFVPDAAAAVREMARVVRPGGRVVIGELGTWSLWAMQRRMRGWLGSRLWRDATFRTASELRALLTQAGLRAGAVRGAVFYPPHATVARWMAPADSAIGRMTTLGAAFIAAAGTPR